MRVAVIANSIAAGLRIAGEIENLPGVRVFIVVCNVGKRKPVLRWSRELFLLAKSVNSRAAARLRAYWHSGQLLVFGRTLDDPVSITRLHSLRCDVGLHAANVIYRESTISAFRLGILNAHIGLLPEYRGRSVAEWSVLQGDPTGVTVFFIDSGIDTGQRIVLRELVLSNGHKDVRTLKNMLFGCDAWLYRKAVETLRSPEFEFECNDVSKGRRYYVMSKLFVGAVNEILSSCGSVGQANRPEEAADAEVGAQERSLPVAAV